MPDARLDPGSPTSREKGPLLSLEMEAQSAEEVHPHPPQAPLPGGNHGAAAPVDPLRYASGIAPTRFSSGPVEQPTRAGETGAASAAGFLLIVDLLEGMLDSTRRQLRGWRKKSQGRSKTNGGKSAGADSGPR